MTFIHPKADVAECSIGSGTNIWQFVVILQGAKIGMDCNICANSLIEGNVCIGNRVTIKSGVYIWDGVILEDDVFVGPCVTFTNDIFPRSKQYLSKPYTTKVGKGASIGANATLLAGIHVGAGALVGAGSVVVKDVPENAVVVGNPAKVIRYVKR